MIRTGFAWFVAAPGVDDAGRCRSQLEHTTSCSGIGVVGLLEEVPVHEAPAARMNVIELPEVTVNGLRFGLFGSGPGLYETLPRNWNWRLPLTPSSVFLTTIVAASGAGLTAK